MKILYFIVILAVFLILPEQVFPEGTEEITLTTYYPAPYGEYYELQADVLAVGPNATVPADAGDVNIEDDLNVGGILTVNAISGNWYQSGTNYVRLGSIQICWGIGSVAINNAYQASAAIVFPIAFKNGTVPVVTCTANNTSQTNLTTGRNYIPSVTPNGFTAYLDRLALSANKVTGTLIFDWIAIGIWR